MKFMLSFGAAIISIALAGAACRTNSDSSVKDEGGATTSPMPMTSTTTSKATSADEGGATTSPIAPRSACVCLQDSAGGCSIYTRDNQMLFRWPDYDSTDGTCGSGQQNRSGCVQFATADIQQRCSGAAPRGCVCVSDSAGGCSVYTRDNRMLQRWPSYDTADGTCGPSPQALTGCLQFASAGVQAQCR